MSLHVDVGAGGVATEPIDEIEGSLGPCRSVRHPAQRSVGNERAVMWRGNGYERADPVAVAKMGDEVPGVQTSLTMGDDVDLGRTGLGQNVVDLGGDLLSATYHGVERVDSSRKSAPTVGSERLEDTVEVVVTRHLVKAGHAVHEDDRHVVGRQLAADCAETARGGTALKACGALLGSAVGRERREHHAASHRADAGHPAPPCSSMSIAIGRHDCKRRACAGCLKLLGSTGGRRAACVQ